jgi:hypothetical protein
MLQALVLQKSAKYPYAIELRAFLLSGAQLPTIELETLGSNRDYVATIREPDRPRDAGTMRLRQGRRGDVTAGHRRLFDSREE